MIVRALSTLVIVWLLGFAAFMLSLGKPLEGVSTDAIVVPTGSAGRIDRGIKLIEAGAAQRMLVTCVARDVRPQELAAQYDAPRDLFDCCIDLGFEAVDTRSNANETAAWVNSRGVRSVRLVTSDWHMARAALELRNSLDESQ
ncbi:YdcF family protein [Escherichia coli]|nr:YdcF family protein [Escherichia coli]